MIQALLLMTLAGASPGVGLPIQDAAPIQAPDSLGEAFANWRVDVLTREDGPDAVALLRALIAGAQARLQSAPDDAQMTVLLGDMWAAELDEWERRRDLTNLEARTLELLGFALWTGDEPAAEALSLAARLALDPGRVQRALAAQNRSALAAGAQAGPSEELIAAAVQDAVQAGDDEFVRQVGSAAVPTLRALARAAEIAGPTPTLAPLALLAELDPAAALDVALEHVETGDILRKTQVVRAFGLRSPFASEEVWTREQSGAEILARPAWTGIVSGLLKAPAVPTKWVDPHLAEFVIRDIGSRDLEAPFEGWLLRNWPSMRPVPMVVQRAARGLVQRPEVEAQIRGTQILLLAADATALYSLAGTSDQSLRRTLPPVFGTRTVQMRTAVLRRATVELAPRLDDAYRQALDLFVRGQTDEAAVAALELSSNLEPIGSPAVVDPAGWLAWLQAHPADRATWLRPLLLHLRPLAASQRLPLFGEVAAWIATAPDHPATASRVHALVQVASEIGGADEMLAAAKACASAGFPKTAVEAATLVSPGLLEVEPAKAAALITWLEGQPATNWGELVEQSRSNTGYAAYEPFLKRLSVPDQQRIARALWAQGYDHFTWLDRDEFSLRRPDWLELVSDDQLPPAGRLWALEELLSTPGDPLPPGAAANFAAAVAAGGESPDSHDAYSRVGVDPQRILEALLELPGAAEQTVLDFYVPLDETELADRVHARFPSSTWQTHGSSPLLAALIDHLIQRNDPAWNADLLAAVGPRTTLLSTLVKGIVYLRSPVHLPVAGEVLRRGVFPATDWRLRMVGYVESLASDEAMGHLIAAARATAAEDYRNELFEAAQRVLAWRDIESRWRAATGSVEDR